MKELRILFLTSILALMLVACGGVEEPATPTEAIAAVSTDAPKPVEPTKIPEPTATDTVEPTAEPTETLEPTVEPTATPEEVALFEGDECLACHADKDRLIETAAQVEEAPSESSGVG